jgi:hypothetical protein
MTWQGNSTTLGRAMNRMIWQGNSACKRAPWSRKTLKMEFLRGVSLKRRWLHSIGGRSADLWRRLLLLGVTSARGPCR